MARDKAMASIASPGAAAARRACGCRQHPHRASPTGRHHEARLHDAATVEAMLAIALPLANRLVPCHRLAPPSERKETMTTYQQERLLQTAWTIDLAITCPGRRCEILLNDISSAECLVEDMCSQVLIADIFGAVQIDEVSITLGANRQAPMTIILRAQGFDALHATANLDLLVEEKLTRALAEIFEALHVERCAVL